MPAAIPIPVGKKFGRLTVLGLDKSHTTTGRRVLTICDCGKSVSVCFKMLRTGNTRSCGCLRRDLVADKNKKHNLSNTPEYAAWKSMRGRCLVKSDGRYHKYGVKGIGIDPRWDDFETFLKDVGPKPGPEYSLDRYPNRNGNYEPGNTRWATASEQARNRDSSTTVVFDGEYYQSADLEDDCGLPRGTIKRRTDNGWSVEDAVRTPAVVGRNQYG